MKLFENPAGFWRRFGALILDGIVFMIIGFLFIGIDNKDTRDSINGVVQLIYQTALPIIWFGYTLGKRALGIRIVKKDGGTPTIGTMLLRNIVGGIVYGITFGIALIVSIFMVAIREDKRSIHDFIAGTYVTSNPPSKEGLVD
ncbi:RDD family protein [Heyndrickxia camelliae]|uniref:RDD family protein n=1 Tax=Heyndrickxia camelliae TaxID=1707093 RepID=A0A2N3LK83_9BACI|nr:RDD family protein [Heyndrickxia camelliae]PKR85038.1 RDD family protein [Heyndrickxia camelliae]